MAEKIYGRFTLHGQLVLREIFLSKSNQPSRVHTAILIQMALSISTATRESNIKDSESTRLFAKSGESSMFYPFILTVIAALALLTLIFAGLTYSQVNSDGFCDTTLTTSQCTFDSVTSLSVLNPTCGGKLLTSSPLSKIKSTKFQ